MDKILDRIWIGDWHDGANLQARKETVINVVLNVAKELDDPTWEGEVYLKVSLDDCEPLPPEKLKQCVDFVMEHLRKKHRILVHCAAGASRSVAIVMCVMYESGWDLDDALNFIRTKRAIANPNPVILNSIMEYYGIDKLKELEVLRL